MAPLSEQQQRAEAYLRAKIAAGEAVPSLTQAKAETGISKTVIAEARSRLREEGLIGDLPRTSTKYRLGEPQPRALPATTLEGLEAAKPADAVVTPAERRSLSTPGELHKELEDLYHRVPNSMKPQVMREVMRVNLQLGGSGATLGPGIPRSRADMIFRGSLVLEALGEKDATEAWNMAFQLEAPNGAYVAERPGSEAGEGAQGDARVQGGGAALGLEEGSEGELEETGDRDRDVGSGAVAREEA
jgi:hypothetical protein